jgi:hypothetical protein
VEELCEQYRQGATTRNISEQYNIDKTAVTRHAGWFVGLYQPEECRRTDGSLRWRVDPVTAPQRPL